MVTLRPYQRESVEAVYAHLRERDDNPVVVIPTGGGKTPVMATLCDDAVTRWNGRVLVLAHVKELIEQTAGTLDRMAPHLHLGLYSAGLKRRDTEHPVIVAGIQSVFRRAAELDAFDLVIIDECFVAGTLISTPSGAVPIEQVQPGMFVHNAMGIGQVVAVSARPAHEVVILEYADGTAITCTPNHPIFTQAGWRPAGSLEVGSLAFGVESLRVLRDQVSSVVQTPRGRKPSGPEREAVDEATVLFNLLLETPQQLHAFAPGSQDGQPDHEGPWACAPDPRRQRPDDQSAEEASGTTRRRLDGKTYGPGAQLPDAPSAQVLEDRYCAFPADDRSRIGWTESSLPHSPHPGFLQDDVPGAKRLVRVSHHKSAGGRVVFNLQVGGHPSYFANGILAHNCHLIPPEGEGMYQTFLKDAKVVNPQLRVIGLTATPFRMTSGMICQSDHFLNHVCFEVGVRELIRDGFLCPLRTKAGITKADTSSLHVRGGEFVAGEVEDLMDQVALVRAACAEIVELTKDRTSVLIFSSGIQHGQHIVDVLRTEHGAECGFITGETPAVEREALIARFRRQGGRELFDGTQPLKFLCNVNVLTTGFDAPNVDCVAMLRPTMSPGLYYQMVGRGFRLCDGKADCLVLDFGGNVLRHGPVDQVRVTEPQGDGTGESPAKECPECHALIHAAYGKCPECDYVFPPPERKQHGAEATSAGILSDQQTDTRYTVERVSYSAHTKRDAAPDAPQTLRVDYEIGFRQYKSEWVCIEHDGYARQKAAAWWKARTNGPFPSSVAEAVELANAGALADTTAIVVRSKPKEYDRITSHELGPKPECQMSDLVDESSLPKPAFAEDDIPF